jgi:hypothetical protein
MIEAVVDGNVLKSPVQRVVGSGNDTKKVTDLVIMSTVLKRKPGSDKEWIEDADKSQPVEITFWNEKQGDYIMSVIRTGMGVVVRGHTLHSYLFKPTDDQIARGMQEAVKMRFTGEDISLSLRRVESVTMKPTRAEKAQQAAAETNADGQWSS